MEFKPFLPDLDSKPITNTEKSIDVLFYGYRTTRRVEIIKALSSKYSIISKDGLSIKQMKELIAKSKYVLSIGSYSNTYNDAFRITPALNMGANILFEECKEIWFNDFLIKYFPDRVTFI
jgi:hypothetical protein